MPNARRLAANRANAAKSTGPKSKIGKYRSASNAIKHGLNIAIAHDPSARLEVEALALRILAGRDDEECCLHAREIADALLEYRRSCSAIAMLVDAKLEILTASEVRHRSDVVSPPATIGVDPPLGSHLTAIFAADVKPAVSFDTQVERLDRYARRALSRRKAAVRRFDAACLRADTSDRH